MPSGFLSWWATSAARRPGSPELLLLDAEFTGLHSTLPLPVYQDLDSSTAGGHHKPTRGSEDEGLGHRNIAFHRKRRPLRFRVQLHGLAPSHWPSPASSRIPQPRIGYHSMRLTTTWTSAYGMMAAFRTTSPRKPNRAHCRNHPSPTSALRAWRHREPPCDVTRPEPPTSETHRPFPNRINPPPTFMQSR